VAANSLKSFSGLILLSGDDAPGLTHKLFSTLAPFAVEIRELQVLTIRDRAILTVLIALDPAHAVAIEGDLESLAKESKIDLAIDFQEINELSKSEFSSVSLTLISHLFTPEAIHHMTQVIFSSGGNIEHISSFQRGDHTIIEIRSNTPDIDSLRKELAGAASKARLDFTLKPLAKPDSRKRIVMFDMDSTFIQQEVIDLLAREAGVEAAVSAITESAMRGELDFAESLTARVEQLAGLESTALQRVADQLLLTPGAENLVKKLHSLGHKVGIVSGGFLNVIEPLMKELGIDYYRANTLEISNGVLTGKLIGPIIDRKAKAQSLSEFAMSDGVDLRATVAVGDGANDLDMLKLAGIGIAFNAKPAVAQIADCNINSASFDSIPILIGIE